MLHILEQLQKEKTYACIFTDRENSSKFIFGKIVGLCDHQIAIAAISPDGEYDGIILKNICDIICVETGSAYTDKMQCLIQYKKTEIPPIYLHKTDLKASLLSFAMQHNLVTSIELCNSGFDDIVGTIYKLEQDMVYVEQIDEYGHMNGKSYIPLSEISQISCDSTDERRIAVLSKISSR